MGKVRKKQGMKRGQTGDVGRKGGNGVKKRRGQGRPILNFFCDRRESGGTDVDLVRCQAPIRGARCGLGSVSGASPGARCGLGSVSGASPGDQMWTWLGVRREFGGPDVDLARCQA